MIAKQPRRFRLADHLAVDGQDVAGANLDRWGRQRPSVDRHATLADETLDIAARTDPRTGQKFGDALTAVALIVLGLGLTVVVVMGS